MRKALLVVVAVFAVGLCGAAIACPSGYELCGNACCPKPP